MGIVFVCRNGSLAGKRMEFNESLVSFGRRPTNMVRFVKEQEPGVSNLHCEVFQQDGSYFVRDMASANGTFVDGVQVKDPVALRDGSVILLGNAGPELVVSLPYEEALTLRLGPGQLGNLPPPPPCATATTVPPAAPAAGETPGTPPPPPPPPSDPVASVPPPPPPPVGTPPVPPPPPPPMEAAFARPLPASFSEPLPHRDGIGMPTLMATLDRAKAEVRSEYSNRMRWVYVACAVVLILAVALVVWVRISSSRQIQEMQAALLGQLNQSKKDADDRYNEIKKNTDASTHTKLDQLQKLLDEKTDFVRKLATDAQKAGVSSDAVSQEMIRNREALKAIQAQIGDLTAFVSFKERYGKCVYSLVLKFTEGGEVKYSFVGSAFCLSTSLGLLGTTARVVEAVKPLLEDGKFQLIARCDGDAQYCYVVQQTFVHPDFKRSDSGIGKDVAILKLNLRRLKADGTQDSELPLPAALQAAGDDELDQVVSGVNVAVFGFSDLDRAKLEGATPAAGVATLSTNIVDGTYAFTGESVPGRRFDLLKHNCTVMKGFAGAPVVNTKNHVVGIQSNTITLAAARGGLQIPAPNSACAVSIKVMKALEEQFLKRLAEGK